MISIMPRQSLARRLPKTTYDVDNLRQPQTDADSQLVGRVADGTYQLVVAAVSKLVVVQPLRVGLRPQQATVAPAQRRHQHHCHGDRAPW